MSVTSSCIKHLKEISSISIIGLSIKKNLFPVQRVDKIEASRAAAI